MSRQSSGSSSDNVFSSSDFGASFPPSGASGGTTPLANSGFYVDTIPLNQEVIIGPGYSGSTDSTLWGNNNLCFCFVTPVANFSFLRSLSTHDFTSAGTSTPGKIAVWGMPDFLTNPIKLNEQTIPGPIPTATAGLTTWSIQYTLNISAYKWLAFSVDPAWGYDPLQPATEVQYGVQSNYTAPYYGNDGPVDILAHLGSHTVGSTFGTTFPSIPDSSTAKYLITKWFRIGLAP